MIADVVDFRLCAGYGPDGVPGLSSVKWLEDLEEEGIRAVVCQGRAGQAVSFRQRPWQPEYWGNAWQGGLLTTGHRSLGWFSFQDMEAEWRLGQGQTQQSLVRRKLRQEMDWEKEWRWYEPGH